jgi:P-type Mg2+ transporter
VLEVCTNAEAAPGEVIDLDAIRPQIDRLFADFSGQGLRTLGVAYRDIGSETGMHKGHEAGMTFLGLLILEDPLRVGIVETLQKLLDLGIATKLITGDNRLVAAHVARQAGLPETKVLTGSDLRQISDDALTRQVDEVSVFAEIEPNQKERIILALKKAGLVVGYMGDGINDASALHAADVGISVADAVDVAKEAADFVLLEKDLGVLERGVREGRATFANTMKYVFMATSANFGNMFSMAGATFFASFLPLLPKQILLINVLSDLPAMAIATDRLDPELVVKPRRWDNRSIRRFMITFGIVSSVFDYLTFGVLLFLHVPASTFRTAWFLESVLSEILILLVIRTRRAFFRSPIGSALLWSSVGAAGVTLALPYTPLASLLGFVPLPLVLVAGVCAIVALYVLASEASKRLLFSEAHL